MDFVVVLRTGDAEPPGQFFSRRVAGFNESGARGRQHPEHPGVPTQTARIHNVAYFFLLHHLNNFPIRGNQWRLFLIESEKRLNRSDWLESDNVLTGIHPPTLPQGRDVGDGVQGI